MCLNFNLLQMHIMRDKLNPTHRANYSEELLQQTLKGIKIVIL